ncbi:hypothetical protein NJT12_11210 [Flavobacterium sp. AC]|uniref:Uncharacterized protein n=1 Tax=Flavobacterium azizsancarii TaxID=2961580 RepID=A0ABT4WCB9_9FLAO|nr:hypothetical protein [Flavobacterium azizsancarii]
MEVGTVMNPNNIIKNEGPQKQYSFDSRWATQVGAAILCNRFGKASDNYLSGTGFADQMVKEYFKTIIGVGANTAPKALD